MDPTYLGRLKNFRKYIAETVLPIVMKEFAIPHTDITSAVLVDDDAFVNNLAESFSRLTGLDTILTEQSPKYKEKHGYCPLVSEVRLFYLTDDPVDVDILGVSVFRRMLVLVCTDLVGQLSIAEAIGMGKDWIKSEDVKAKVGRLVFPIDVQVRILNYITYLLHSQIDE